MQVDYDPLPAVTDLEAAARDDAPLLFPDQGTNVADTFGTEGDEDPLAGAEVVVRGRFVNQRLAPASMEPNAIAVVPEADGAFTVWVSTQVPFDVRNDVAEALGLDRSLVRTIAPGRGRRLRREARDLSRVPAGGASPRSGSGGPSDGSSPGRSRWSP